MRIRPCFCARLAHMPFKGKQIGRHVLNALMALSVLSGVAQIATRSATGDTWEFDALWQPIMYVSLITAIAVCLVELVAKDRQGNVHAARMFARALVALLIFAFGFDVLFIEDTPLSSTFVFQFVCVIAYQMRNDPNLDRHNPREGGFRGAIPLSFYNLFWIFVICSVAGLVGETIVSFFRDGHWESRAGLVIGPFSPIYGMGAVLITVALNRLEERKAIVLFVVAGVVGAAFEYFAGWFWESAFGIVAWSYESQPFNIHGHTSLLMACVWGAIGLVWMKALLPQVMKLVDLIPLRARVPLTLAFTVVLLVDAILTVICMNCWYLRKLGEPIETPWQEFCAQHFGDEFMQSRFETMSMWTSLADR